MGERLAAMGFTLEHLPFGEVSNLWARHGRDSPLFVFAGHTDVVPTGPLEAWDFDPFGGVVDAGFLQGRGAADMKGSLAAMVTACERFLGRYPEPRGSIAFLLTSDEEGPAKDGTVRVVEHLKQRGEHIDACVVGEPTSVERLGDMIKNGRRGSLNGRLVVHGVQGHVAYPDRADNPVHRFGPVLAELCQVRWDEGNRFFPPTGFQVSNLSAGTGADNVIPGQLSAQFNFRYSTAIDHETLIQRVESVLAAHGLRYEVQWNHSGRPFLTEPGPLVDAARDAIADVAGIETELSTTGGTSDARFIAPTGAQVVELGPTNRTIHQVNERIPVRELDDLSRVYEGILERLLVRPRGP